MKLVGPDKHLRGEEAYYLAHWPEIERECHDAVLDVGCGTGKLLALLGQRRELVREGVELNADRAALAGLMAGCPVHRVPIERFAAPVPFDVILMINVLSHIPYLRELLDNLPHLLSPRGKLVLDSGEMERDVRRSDVLGWGIPDHVHFLGMGTLDYICSRFGWRPRSRHRLPYSEELFSQARFRAPGRSPARNAVASSFDSDR